MYENENQSFDNREQDYHYTNTPEQQAPTRPRKKNTSAARIAKKAGAIALSAVLFGGVASGTFQLRGRLSEQCFNSCILGKCFRFFPDNKLFQQPVKGYHTGQHRQRSILRKSGRLQRCGIRYAFYRIHHK